ncbi:MAG: hypothetical protein KAS72_07820 [Phycisphaerales bacterium]|nr:hypothetical protein [Phycisphaerales bacterium]
MRRSKDDRRRYMPIDPLAEAVTKRGRGRVVRDDKAGDRRAAPGPPGDGDEDVTRLDPIEPHDPPDPGPNPTPAFAPLPPWANMDDGIKCPEPPHEYHLPGGAWYSKFATDDFNDGAIDPDWTQERAGWTENLGTLRASNMFALDPPPRILIYRNDVGMLPNCRVQAKITQLLDDARVLGRIEITGANVRCYAAGATVVGSTLALYLYEPGGVTTLHTSASVVNLNDTIGMRIYAREIVLLHNGNAVGTYSPADQVVTGYVGLGTRTATASTRFDDFEVVQL